MLNSKIIFFVSGSIAAFKAAAVVSRLMQDGCEVQVVCSKSALRFVGEATFEGLTGRRVLTDLWEPGRAMDHIHLSRWADFGVVCPASANTLAHMALGLAENVVSSTLLAWPANKPLFIFPAMNSAMLAAAPTQAHIVSLRERGFVVAESNSGSLACGEVGSGRLLEPDEILSVLRASAAPSNSSGAILVTSGATREPIDGIRFITNHSTGLTGSELSDQLQRAGFAITYLHGQGAAQPNNVHKSVEFSNYSDLREKLRAELAQNSYVGVVHCAAVSDFSVGKVKTTNSSNSPSTFFHNKLDSGKNITLDLEPTEKLLPLLREFSRNKDIKVIGFKLTLNATGDAMLAAAKKILSHDVDAIVANDWSQVAADRSRHPGIVCTQDQQTSFANTVELADLIATLIANPLPTSAGTSGKELHP